MKPEGLHAQLAGPELGGRDLLVDLLEEDGLEVLAVGDVALDLVLELELADAGQELLEGLLVLEDGLGRLLLVGQLVPFGEECLAALDAGREVVGAEARSAERDRRGRRAASSLIMDVTSEVRESGQGGDRPGGSD